ncbi:hypothetical protein JOL79_06930 [Microbispora sp. RL4-1S]|uniref:Uncharacterized protein n=1 Tax=Microbispora oryzae TaxID=2806554 RepID=A0A940WGC4_9ACTN|nr:hypothetical protein [Microbispora oryzae]MBP2703532.1 hypothetical protein [Microbispora oryzae]
MAEIEVEATAHVLGLRPGRRERFEDTPFLRAAVAGGYLTVTGEGDAESAPGGAESDDEAAEARSRAHHPAGKRRGPVGAAEGLGGG